MSETMSNQELKTILGKRRCEKVVQDKWMASLGLHLTVDYGM